MVLFLGHNGHYKDIVIQLHPASWHLWPLLGLEEHLPPVLILSWLPRVPCTGSRNWLGPIQPRKRIRSHMVEIPTSFLGHLKSFCRLRRLCSKWYPVFNGQSKTEYNCFSSKRKRAAGPTGCMDWPLSLQHWLASQRTLGDKVLPRKLGFLECYGHLQRQMDPTQSLDLMPRLTTPHTHPKSMKRFITYIIEVSGESRAGLSSSSKWLESKERELAWVFIVVRG